MAVASYPHIEMHVRDDSIYVGLDTEIMPLDKPLYMMKTQRGPVGVPIWCPTYTNATLIFGTDTFNKRSEFWSEQSYFLLKTLVSNGAFIMRVASQIADNSKVYLECGIKDADVPQWQRNPITGKFVLDEETGCKIKINKNGTVCGVITETSDELDRYEESPDRTIDAVQLSRSEYYTRIYGGYSYVPCFDTNSGANGTVLYKAAATDTPTITEVTAAEAAALIEAGSKFVYKAVTTDAVEAPYDNYVPVDDVADVDAGDTHKTIVPTTLEATIITPNTEIPYGIYYKRVANTASTTQYVKIQNLIAGIAGGDKINTDGVITRQVPTDTYTEVTATTPVATTKYYTKSGDVYSLAGTDGTLTAFEDGVTYYTKEVVNVTTTIGKVEDGCLYEHFGTLALGDPEPQATIRGKMLVWRAVLRLAADDRADDSEEISPTETGGCTWYPIMSVLASNPGTWGQVFGFRFYYDRNSNTTAATVQNGCLMFNLAPVELKADDTIPTPITDAYGQQVVKGVVKDNVIDPTTEQDITFKKLIPGQYSGSRELPVKITIIPKSFETIGRLLMDTEIDAKANIANLYPAIFNDTDDSSSITSNEVVTFVDKLLNGGDPGVTKAMVAEVDDPGYMANIVSCIDTEGVPYFASYVQGTYDEANETQFTTIANVVDMNDESAFYLLGGNDGGTNGIPTDFEVEKYIRDQIDAGVAQTQVYLIDYLRCPFNNVIDTGVSLKTKKSYLDFMGFRDNLAVFLTSQQIWKNQDGSFPKELTQYEDESVGAALRAYGLLMREDIENATEANRCVIFLAAGMNSDHTGHDLVASTLWIALKNAEYLNKTYIDKEPVERPNSEVNCFDKGVTWTAAAEETRSRIWNAGLNYTQYCDQTHIHYASVRTIYRYDTSVLCDMTTMRAVTFCKDIIRAEWAIWAGSKRRAEDLNARITKSLNEKLSAMLNNKYQANVKVYQTDEDKKYGYVRHVDLELTSAAQNRVWLATIICKREGFDPNAEE